MFILDEDGDFWVNAEGNPISDASCSRGTFWDKFGKVVGVQGGTNIVRRASEKFIKSNKDLQPFIKNLNKHSDTVGQAVYNKKAYVQSAEYINMLSSQQGMSCDNDSFEEEIESKRRKLVEDDQRNSLNAAKEKVLRDKKKKSSVLTKQKRLKTEDRDFLQAEITKQIGSDVHKKTRNRFPGKIFLVTSFFYFPR